MKYQTCGGNCSKCGEALMSSLKVGTRVEEWCFPGWKPGTVAAVHPAQGLVYVRRRHSDGGLYTSTKVLREVRAKCACEDFWVHWRRNPVGNALAMAAGVAYIAFVIALICGLK